MANPHGTPIWYELLTPDHAAAKRFYDAAVGWTIGPAPAGDVDYRMIAAGDPTVGGVMQLTNAMTAGGARPGWLTYLAADDVDATAGRITAAGGAMLMPPFDLPGVGRMAFCADPQGAPFYIMRDSSEADSNSFTPQRTGAQNGHCSWNELWTSDAASAVTFYRTVFGWESPNSMPVGPGRGYHFVHSGDLVLGAIGQAQEGGSPPRWTFYFWVPDLDAAIEQAKAGGGAITTGPHDVPGGARVITGTDPHGAVFALVGPGKQEN